MYASTEQLMFNPKLIYTPRRRPVERSRVPENMAIVTAREIAAMHANSVGEVLERMPGLWVIWSSDVGGPLRPSIEGGDVRHVLVLVDGMPWNNVSSGTGDPADIPVGIIDRIEVIKGPASSAWGSSLGGVIAIYTKGPGYRDAPEGNVALSLGKNHTRAASAELRGRGGRTGYYLFAQEQASDGVGNSDGIDGQYAFAKGRLHTDPATFNFSLGVIDHDYDLGSFDFGMSQFYDSETAHLRLGMEARPWRGSRLTAMAYAMRRQRALKTVLTDTAALHNDTEEDENAYGGSAQLSVNRGRSTSVFGVDFRREGLESIVASGLAMQSVGAPPIREVEKYDTKLAAYYNLTLRLDEFTIVPGLRYDYSDTADGFISPSIGATYTFGHTVFRASVSHGFADPPLAMTRLGGLFLKTNPDIEREKVWSYQAGFETNLLQPVRLSATVFHHDVSNAIVYMRTPDGNRTVINEGSSLRRGIELGLSTLPWNGLSLHGNLTYVDLDGAGVATGNAALRYRGADGFYGEIAANYSDLSESGNNPYRRDILASLLLSKRCTIGNRPVELFCKVRNLFDGDSYPVYTYEKPGRWLEAGIKLSF